MANEKTITNTQIETLKQYQIMAMKEWLEYTRKRLSAKYVI